MSKNVVVITMVIPKDKNLDKFGGWEWMTYTKSAWKYWCSKNNCELVIYDKPSIDDTTKFRITVQRWFDVFNFLEEKNVKYNQIAIVDASSIPKWDCPNFFDITDNKFTVGLENDNLGWVYQSIRGYEDFFNGYKLDIGKYFNSGFVIFNDKHRNLFDKFKKVYMERLEDILKVKHSVKRGTCQTPLNYVVQMENTDVNWLPSPFRMSHLPRKDLLQHNWQLNEDKTPFFIKYGHVWVFSGFDKGTRNNLMKQTWDLVKGNYNE